MATQTLKAPSGPRAGRNGESTRLSHCGGISKRGQQKQRLDKDGDLVMDLGSGMKGRGRGTNNQRDPHRATSNGSTTHGHPTTIKGTRTTKVDLASVQRSILRQMGEKAMPPKGSRTLARSTRQAEKDGKGNSTVGDLDQIKVYGLKESKAASNPGGGTKDLLNFLERKATAPNATTGETVRIKKSRHEGDAMIISVRPEDTPKIIRLNNYTFAGAKLSIELDKQAASQTSTVHSAEAADVKELLRCVLARRYTQESKLLDLSNLGNDPELVNSGIFGSVSTTSKLFPALMKVCDDTFPTEQQKTEAVLGVSLAGNELSNLDAVKTLAQTFPSLKNLDLSNNQFKSIGALDAWRPKFRQLEHLIVAGNPLEESDPSFMAKLMEWYPKLRTIRTSNEPQSPTHQVAGPSLEQLVQQGVQPNPLLQRPFDQQPAVQQPVIQQPDPVLQQLGLPADFGSAMDGKLEEQVLKERMALELTNRTGMTIQYSGMCLDGSNWVLEDAYRAFEGAKGTLPQEAFVQL